VDLLLEDVGLGFDFGIIVGRHLDMVRETNEY
jgi:hypothetical protein